MSVRITGNTVVKSQTLVNFPPAPALNLDFTTGVLPAAVTFSRGTNAMLYDSTGKLTYAPNNLLTYSNTLTNAAWSKLAGGTGVIPPVTLVAGAGPSGEDAYRCQFDITGSTGNNANDVSYVTQAPTNDPAYEVASFYAKSNTGSNQTIFIRAKGQAAAITVTTSWQRFYILGTSSTSLIMFGLRGSITTSAVPTADVLICNCQLERVTYQTTPSAYVATTTAAYYGPRYDYDPATLTAKGLLIEESRQNLLTYSEQFDNAAWAAGFSGLLTFGSGSVANAIISPDGTLTADKIVEDTSASAVHRVFNNVAVTVTNGVSVAHSIYVKAAGRNRVRIADNNLAGVTFDLTTGATSSVSVAVTAYSAQNVGNGWWRLIVVVTSASVSGRLAIFLDNGSTTTYTGDGVSGVYVWGAQIENNASFATSYIPTSAASVTRNADVATVTGSSFSTPWSAANGTFLTTFDTPASGTRPVLNVDNNTTNNQIQIYTSSMTPTYNVLDGGVAQATITLGTVNSTTTYRIAVEYKANDFSAAMGGVLGTPDVGGTVPTVDRLRIGADVAANYLNGHVAKIQYWPARFTDAQLQLISKSDPSLTVQGVTTIYGSTTVV